MADSVLRGIYISSGVNPEGKPFCQVTLEHSEDQAGPLLPNAVGQLDPREVRKMALGWLSAAEAAIHDASVFKLMLSEVGIGTRAASMFIRSLREQRIDADEMTEPGDG